MPDKPMMPTAISLSEILAQRSRGESSPAPLVDQSAIFAPEQPSQSHTIANAKHQTDNFWTDRSITMPGGKSSIHLRLDSDVLLWFKAQGKGHLTRMNAVLRAYMEAKKG